ncbi:peptidyl-prolyl cis-trans isomerase [Parasedimentitalea huanghaiensis]|uniref:Parvulin-like PPIase n=1 Tax=Parasedimentitalea huanghaiensis TaxID=2682100 RepID=A0A6L6WRT8_9RHOB|nr:peptidylprolyl isomerase [Zongyanglinia huanghaiensis]MVO18647.1 peptidyl-prolyl cis-trans isomerase [Zongyanglinia huanghaiensis]
MKILKEPLLHFLLMAVAIFAWFIAVDDSAPQTNQNVVEITATDLDLLATQFEKTWQRQPSEQERKKLTDGFVRQEILVREAIALGMDQNDALIRRRLQQKMEFFIASFAEALEPTTDELEEYYQTNSAKYEIGPKVAFLQVFLGDAPQQQETTQILEQLRSGQSPGQLGKPTQLSLQVSLAADTRIDAMFGTGFAAAISAMPVEEWTGPVKSGYGYHLVFVEQKEAGHLPPLQDVQVGVVADWRTAKKMELMELQYEKLAARYTVHLPSAADEAQP